MPNYVMTKEETDFCKLMLSIWSKTLFFHEFQMFCWWVGQINREPQILPSIDTQYKSMERHVELTYSMKLESSEVSKRC